MQERTCCNPLANKKPICCHAESLSYAAAVTVSGLATKLQDNADDESGWRKHLPKLAGNIISPARDEATAVLNSSGFPTQQVIKTLAQQTEIETNKAGFMDASEPTAQAYGSIFSHLAKITHQASSHPSLFLLGSSLGRLIYWKDALDDWETDQQRGRFNPLNYQPAHELPALVNEQFTQLKSSVAAIPWKRHRELITSVISHTAQHHQAMMTASQRSKKSRKRKKQEGDSWWNSCDCCCTDCGCGTSSCDSCGCDSCDCCPCN